MWQIAISACGELRVGAWMLNKAADGTAVRRFVVEPVALSLNLRSQGCDKIVSYES